MQKLCTFHSIVSQLQDLFHSFEFVWTNFDFFIHVHHTLQLCTTQQTVLVDVGACDPPQLPAQCEASVTYSCLRLLRTLTEVLSQSQVPESHVLELTIHAGQLFDIFIARFTCSKYEYRWILITKLKNNWVMDFDYAQIYLLQTLDF